MPFILSAARERERRGGGRTEIDRERASEREGGRQEGTKRYNDLSGKVNDLNTNDGLEREIRSKFDVVKPGETVLLVVDKEIPAQAPQETSVIKKLWN